MERPNTTAEPIGCENSKAVATSKTAQNDVAVRRESVFLGKKSLLVAAAMEFIALESDPIVAAKMPAISNPRRMGGNVRINFGKSVSGVP